MIRVLFILVFMSFFCSGCDNNNNAGSSNISTNIDSSGSEIFKPSCDSLSIMLRFIDQSKDKVWNESVLVILVRGEERDLRDIATEQNRIYAIEKGNFICLNKKMLLSKYNVPEIDSLQAFIYKKGIGLSKGFSIYLNQDSITIPVQLSIRD